MRQLILLLPIGLLLAACGGNSSSSSSSDGGEVIKTVSISEKEYSLSPAGVTLSRPGTYEFTVTNDGQITHELEIEGMGIEEKTGDIEPGSSKTLRVTLSEGGSYELYCPIDGHRQQGMEGMVTVGGGAGTGTTTNDEDTTGRPGY